MQNTLFKERKRQFYSALQKKNVNIGIYDEKYIVHVPVHVT